MRLIFKSLFLFLLSFTSNSLLSQDNQNGVSDLNLITHTHTYTFKDAETKEIIYSLKQDLLKIESVSNVDITYSEVKKSGVIIVTTKESNTKAENDDGFKPTLLKKHLISHHITPIQYRLIESSEK